MEPDESANLRIPAILISSYKDVMSTPSGRADLKRISVCCGVCRLVRYYSLTRGVTRINRVVACEACRHCYQAFKREPVSLHCTKGDGSCWREMMFTKTKCRCCWVMQMLERTPIPLALYKRLMPFMPAYIKNETRGHPIVANTLVVEERGFLSLEVHTGTDWKDVTEQKAIKIQQQPFVNLPEKPMTTTDDQEPEEDLTEMWGAAAVLAASNELYSGSKIVVGEAVSETKDSNANSIEGSPPTEPAAKSMRSVATRGSKKVKRKPVSQQFVRSSQDSDENSSSAENSFESADRGKATKRTRGAGKRGRAMSKKGRTSRLDKLMAGIKEGLYGMSVDETNNNNSSAQKSGLSSGVPSSNCSTSDSSEPPSPLAMDEDVTVEDEFEDSPERMLPPPVSKPLHKSKPTPAVQKLHTDGMIGLLALEQKKYLKDFNPRNSARVRRKKDRIEYFDAPKPPKTIESLVHDHKGRFIGVDRQVHDMCDCLQQECPGCHFPCPKCRSNKCGAECRSNRKWFYERVDVEGTEQFYVNKMLKH